MMEKIFSKFGKLSLTISRILLYRVLSLWHIWIHQNKSGPLEILPGIVMPKCNHSNFGLYYSTFKFSWYWCIKRKITNSRSSGFRFCLQSGPCCRSCVPKSLKFNVHWKSSVETFKKLFICIWWNIPSKTGKTPPQNLVNCNHCCELPEAPRLLWKFLLIFYSRKLVTQRQLHILKKQNAPNKIIQVATWRMWQSPVLLSGNSYVFWCKYQPCA